MQAELQTVKSDRVAWTGVIVTAVMLMAVMAMKSPIFSMTTQLLIGASALFWLVWAVTTNEKVVLFGGAVVAAASAAKVCFLMDYL